MKIYNTLTRQKDEFVPLTPGQVKMYCCGQTVYNDIHIGNARFYVVFDAIRRYLEYRGYAVRFIQNFTDVDDKIIARAADEGCTSAEVAEKYIARTLQDLDALGVLRATVNPRATEEMPEIIAMVETLLAKGFAYERNGSVFFETAKARGYGKLSRKNPDDLEAGARVEVNADKRSPLDFVLWKPAKPGEPYWESPWGRGRPGWHIECSAMARKYLGHEIDIHGGGSDLMFPHHENEIAQSEAANGAPFARYWMHNGAIMVGHKKMSKSLGNFHTYREVADKFPPDVIRFFLVSGHYRMPMEYGEHLLQAAAQGLARIKNCAENLAHASGEETETALWDEARQYKNAFEAAMDDDFNTADAVAAVFELVKFVNVRMPKPSKTLAKRVGDLLSELCGLLGIIITGDAPARGLDADINAWVEQRQEARKSKDWAKADEIRDRLAALGVEIKDTPDGVRWVYKNP